MVLNDNQKIGVFLSAVGIFFTIIGIMFFFDRGFLAIGNISFLFGVALVIGFRKIGRVFIQKQRLKGSIPFILGMIIVLTGRTFIGFLIEAFGFFNLFGDFFPVVLSFARNIPIIGSIFNLPIISTIVDRITGRTSLPV